MSTTDKVTVHQWRSEDAIQQLKREWAAQSGTDVDSISVVFSPYRVCPVGAHIDHQGGRVAALALNFGLLLVFSPADTVRLESEAFRGRVEFELERVPELREPQARSAEARSGSGGGGQERAGAGKAAAAAEEEEEAGWGRYLRGAAHALHLKGHRLRKGIHGRVVSGRGVEESGISSSAALGVACLLALAHANGLQLGAWQLVELDRLIENSYLGLSNGILDQSAILLSRRNQLTLIDCAHRTHRLLPFGAPPDFQLLLVFSGLRQALTGSGFYNNRVQQCRDAAAQLLAEVQRGSGGGAVAAEAVPQLGQVTSQQFQDHCAALADAELLRRGRHFFGEMERVGEGAQAWAAGDMRAFGELVSASGQSSVHNYEVGCPPMQRLQQLLQQHPLVYGARFSGAGFRGACMALVSAGHAVAVAHEVVSQYCLEFPQLAAEAKAIVCNSGDGARVL